MRSYKITELGSPLQAVEKALPAPNGDAVLCKVDITSRGTKLAHTLTTHPPTSSG